MVDTRLTARLPERVDADVFAGANVDVRPRGDKGEIWATCGTIRHDGSCSTDWRTPRSGASRRHPGRSPGSRLRPKRGISGHSSPICSRARPLPSAATRSPRIVLRITTLACASPWPKQQAVCPPLSCLYVIWTLRPERALPDPRTVPGSGPVQQPAKQALMAIGLRRFALRRAARDERRQLD